VYTGSLKPRLDQLKAAVSPDDPLPLRMVMVSHIDDDHINGILALAEKLVKVQEDGMALPYEILTMWHNSFDDLLGNEDEELTASVQKAAAASITGSNSSKFPVHEDTALVLASVNQGRRLRDATTALGATVNEGFSGLVMVPEGEPSREVDLGDGLTFTVIGPQQEQVEALQEEWNKQAKKLGVMRAAAFVDESVFNLSSIVVVAKLGKKTMLLTGDSRGDCVLKGLERAGMLKNGVCHFDLLKINHHGSDNNVSTEYFRRLTADYYVVSGDGKHGNPEKATFQMLLEARGKEEFTIHLTNDKPATAVKFLKDSQAGKKYDVVIRDKDSYSTWVDLADESVI
jgi:beta-lactamase superfamily II metal-dependent hydrolase